MSVRKRGNKWVVDLYLPNGRRFVRTVGGKKQAEQVEKKIESEKIEGKWNIRETKDISFEELIEKYLEYAQMNKAKSTYEVDRVRINKHLVPYFGDMLISMITSQMVDEYKIRRSRTGASPKTINNELLNLSHILKMAMRWRYVDRNVVSGVEKMKVVQNMPRFLSETEIERILYFARESYIYPLLVTALHTGMRKSELLNLKWLDIDFPLGTIMVQSKTDWHTKNYKARVLQMTPVLISVLLAHRKLQNAMGFENEYVFTWRGRQIHSGISKSLEGILGQAGIKGVTLHTFRHTFASQLVMAGVPLRDVQELMGHESFETTLRYAHLSEEHVKKQVLKLPFSGYSDNLVTNENEN